MRRILFLSVIFGVTVGMGALPAIAQPTVRQISVSEYRDKMQAGWIGQMAGVSWGADTEFQYNGRIIPESEVPEWSPGFINDAFDQDDLYVEMTFLRTLELYGLDATIIQAGVDFADSQYQLWHANLSGRNNIRAGIMPPDSGHPNYNAHSDDIDYQIEADFSGLIAPGLPNTAIALGNKFGRLMNYGDGLYGGQFVGGMYAEAFFNTDPVAIVQAGLACIPAGSQYAEAVQDMLNWYQQDPTNWQNTWQLLMNKYHWNADYRRCSCDTADDFNIDAKLNGAYVVMGLLYGQGDMDETMKIAMRCGEDSDCNPSTAGGVLATAIGLSNVPSYYKSALNYGLVFSYTAYNFPQLIDVCEALARQAVIDAGGWIENDGGGDVFVIPVQTPQPGDLEQCWDPGPTSETTIFSENFDTDPFNGRWTQPGDVGYLTDWYDACGPDVGYIYSECPWDRTTTYTDTPFTTEGYITCKLWIHYTQDYGQAISIDLLKDWNWITAITSLTGTYVDWNGTVLRLSDNHVYTGIRINLKGIGGHWGDWRRVDCISITGYPASVTIIQHPTAQNICLGSSAQFTVAAIGQGALGYQWKKNGVNLSDGGHYAGCTTSTLTVSNADGNDLADYRCAVTDDMSTAYSNVAALSFGSGASITQQPLQQTVIEGSTAIFSITAAGASPLSYQWQKNQINLSNGGHYSGCTTATLMVTSASSNDEASYRCVVTNPCGTETSNSVTLTLAPPGPPSITQQPSNQSVIPGGTVAFSVAAIGTSPLSYQWQKNQVDLSEGGHYAGATTNTLTVSNADINDEADYRCVVTNSYGSIPSDQVSLTVTECITPVLLNGGFEEFGPNDIGTYWTGYTRPEAPASVNYSILIVFEVEGVFCQQIETSYVASGGAGIYQVITGCASGATYTISGWMKTNSANCRATVKCTTDGSTSYSSAIDFNPPATTTSTSWVAFSGQVTATASTMTLFLDSQTYVAGSTNKAAYFDGLAVTCYTSSVTPTITQHPSAQDVCLGSTAQFTVAATGEGTLIYQWQKNQINLSNGGHYSGVTTTTLTVSNVDSGDEANYRCVVTNAGGSTNSNEAALTLNTSTTTITSHPDDVTADPGSYAELYVTATGGGTLAYQWQKDQVNLHDDGNHIFGANESLLIIDILTSEDSGQYRCVVTGDCDSVTSNEATLTVVTPPIPGDFDLDGDVDLADFGFLQACLDAGNQGPSTVACEDADLNGDTYFDSGDLAKFLGCLSGENIPANLNCVD